MSAPLDVIAKFLRAKFGRPSPDVEEVIKAFAALADGSGGTAPAAGTPAATLPDDLTSRLDAIDARLAKLEEAPDAAAASSDQPDVTGRLDAIERSMVLLQGTVSKLEAPHLAAAPTRAAAPARAAAPTAKPAA